MTAPGPSGGGGAGPRAHTNAVARVEGSGRLRRRLALAVAWLLSGAAAALVVWGLSLAVRGAWARIVPAEPAPRRVEHAVVVRESGTGRYLVYTEMQVRPGDLLITPDGRLWRIEEVGFDTAWARLLREGGSPPKRPASPWGKPP